MPGGEGDQQIDLLLKRYSRSIFQGGLFEQLPCCDEGRIPLGIRNTIVDESLLQGFYQNLFLDPDIRDRYPGGLFFERGCGRSRPRRKISTIKSERGYEGLLMELRSQLKSLRSWEVIGGVPLPERYGGHWINSFVRSRGTRSLTSTLRTTRGRSFSSFLYGFKTIFNW
jgi:hypothetical protein